MTRRSLWRSAALAALLVLLPSPAWANVGPYTWPGTGERTLTISNNLGSQWTPALDKAVAAWNASPWIELSIGPAGSNCASLHRGSFDLCTYTGSATWIGLADVWHIGTDITAVQMWVNSSKYWGPSKRVYVLCHELGHAIGLYHRAAPPLGTTVPTCMVPRFSQAGLPYLPDARDLADVATMYAP